MTKIPTNANEAFKTLMRGQDIPDRVLTPQERRKLIEAAKAAKKKGQKK